MKKAQYKQCKSSGVTGNVLENIISVVSLMYAIGRCWKQTLKTHRMGGGWSPLFQWLSKTKSSLSGPILWPRGAAWGSVSCLLISRTQSLPRLTEEVPAQQYLEIDEVKTDSFRVTWHPLSAEEGQHKLMWIPVYGGKTQEVSWRKRSKNWSQTCSLEVGAYCSTQVELHFKMDLKTSFLRDVAWYLAFHKHQIIL